MGWWLTPCACSSRTGRKRQQRGGELGWAGFDWKEERKEMGQEEKGGLQPARNFPISENREKERKE